MTIETKTPHETEARETIDVDAAGSYDFHVPEPEWKQEAVGTQQGRSITERLNPEPVSSERLEMLYNLSRAESPEAQITYMKAVHELPEYAQSYVYQYIESRNAKPEINSAPQADVMSEKTPEATKPSVPEGPLSEELLEKIHNLGASQNTTALETFGAYLSVLSPEQADQLGSYRAHRILNTDVEKAFPAEQTPRAETLPVDQPFRELTEEQKNITFSEPQKQQDEWIKASQPSVWGKIKKFFGKR